MINYARTAALSLLLALNAAGPFRAEEITAQGEWLVKDKTAHIRIADCKGKLWGVISWADKPDVDTNNPDPALRNRPVLGMPILLGMLPGKDQRWEGDIYNAQNGKIYHSSIRLESADVLHIEGCVLFGLLCGGEDWTRIKPVLGAQDADTPCQHVNAAGK